MTLEPTDAERLKFSRAACKIHNAVTAHVGFWYGPSSYSVLMQILKDEITNGKTKQSKEHNDRQEGSQSQKEATGSCETP